MRGRFKCDNAHKLTKGTSSDKTALLAKRRRWRQDGSADGKGAMGKGGGDVIQKGGIFTDDRKWRQRKKPERRKRVRKTGRAG